MTVSIEGVPYVCLEVFKHDFFAATSRYEANAQHIVVKVGRRADFLGLPLAWLGRLATAHECAMYARLGEIQGIPRFLGRLNPNVFAHAFVPGHPLRRYEQVPDTFFPRLEHLLDEVHRQDVAYVDLEKRGNILVGDDGKPYLIDFQISLHVAPGRSPHRRLARWLLRRLQQSDRYHLLKHWRRHRPDQLSAEQLARAQRRPIWIDLHRRLAAPFVRFRRRTLQRVEKHVPTDPLAAPGKRQ